MGEDIRGYVASEIIRKDSGSPAVDYVFSDVSETILVDNLGSAPIYVAFDITANPANSGTAFIQSLDTLELDLKAGSVSVQSSGITSSEVQVIRLT